MRSARFPMGCGTPSLLWRVKCCGGCGEGGRSNGSRKSGTKLEYGTSPPQERYGAHRVEQVTTLFWCAAGAVERERSSVANERR